MLQGKIQRANTQSKIEMFLVQRSDTHERRIWIFIEELTFYQIQMSIEAYTCSTQDITLLLQFLY